MCVESDNMPVGDNFNYAKRKRANMNLILTRNLLLLH